VSAFGDDPGRIVYDEPSPFSKMDVSVHDARAKPEFVDMERGVAEAIYAGA